MSDERIRESIEDAVGKAEEAGWSIIKVRDEFEYAIQSVLDDGGFAAREEIPD